MVLTLYMTPLSPPSRAVLLTAEALGLKLNIKNVDLAKQENKTPHFEKINHQKKVPVLDDDGFKICDSHAIMAYLVEKYGKDDSLYPKDPKKRAIVNERLHFDSGSLFRYVRDIAGPIFLKKTKSVPEELANSVLENTGYLEKFFEDENQWVAGPQLTIVDFSLATTLMALNVFVPLLDKKQFPKINQWIKRIETLPFYKVNKPGMLAFQEIVNKCLQ